MVDKLKALITEKQTANNNSCGTTLLTLSDELNISFAELKPLLSILYKEKIIVVKKGINHDLILLRVFKKKR